MKRFISLFAVTAVLFAASPLLPGNRLSQVKAASFDPGNLASSAFFTNLDSMNVSEIQNFLAQKGSVLANIDPGQLGVDANGRSAAQIIYDASRTNRTDFDSREGYGTSNPLVMGLNPQVVLITLQKEQSLITGTFVAGSPTTAQALASAMGYACPDSSGCNPLYAGFADQVIYGAAQLMKNYYQASNSTFKPGQTYSIPNTQGPPNNAPANQSVYIGNAPTSSLYQYTPHVYNGNYNFWYYTNQWFSLTAGGDVTKVIRGSGPAVYLYEPNPGRLLYVQTYAALVAWGINMSISVIDDAQINILPVVGTISQVVSSDNGYVYVIMNGTKYHIATPTLPATFGLSWSQLSYAPLAELDRLPEGTPMGFLSGTDGIPELYLPSDNRKFYFSDASTVFDWGFSFNTIQVNAASFLANIPTDPNPLQVFYRVREGASMYAVSGGQSLYIPNPTVAYAWGFDPGNASKVGSEIPFLLTPGPTLTQVALNSSNGDVYYMNGGQKHYVSSYDKLAKVGQSRANVVSVSTYLLDKIPSGSNL